MGAAIISLASAVVGGLLVLTGQWLIHRSEDRRHWRGLLRDAAADVATSFSQERAGLTSDRGQGKPTSHIDEVTYVVDRQRALNRLLTLPHGDAFEPQLTLTWETASSSYGRRTRAATKSGMSRERAFKDAIDAFRAAVRHEVQR